uniref:DUF1232 domain-containing protein n=1 Tax=Steinernema glaseri TaxID=37863 RepID=A0A1I8A0A0_9BILA
MGATVSSFLYPEAELFELLKALKSLDKYLPREIADIVDTITTDDRQALLHLLQVVLHVVDGLFPPEDLLEVDLMLDQMYYSIRSLKEQDRREIKTVLPEVEYLMEYGLFPPEDLLEVDLMLDQIYYSIRSLREQDRREIKAVLPEVEYLMELYEEKQNKRSSHLESTARKSDLWGFL